MDLSAEEISQVAAQYNQLSNEEVIQLNRAFLEAVYQEQCPPMLASTNGFNAALPLASVIIDSGIITLEELPDNSRAATNAAYLNDKAKIDSKFAGYKQFASYNFKTPYENVGINVNGIIKMGIKSSFNNTWGNISGSMEVVAYLNLDADIKVALTKERKDLINDMVYEYIGANILIPKTDLLNISDVFKNILDKPWPVGLTVKALELAVDVPVVFIVGPIALNLRFGIGPNLYIQTDANAAIDVSGSFTAMIGGKASVGINYGIQWKTILKIFGITILKLPVPYISPYANSESIREIAYSTIAAPSDFEIAYSAFGKGHGDVSVALTPAIHGTIGVNIAGILGIDFGQETGNEYNFKATITASKMPNQAIQYPSFTIKNDVYKVGTQYIKPWVGITVSPFGFIGYNKRFDLANSRSFIKTVPIYSKNFGLNELYALLESALNNESVIQLFESRLGVETTTKIRTGKMDKEEALTLLQKQFSLAEIVAILTANA